MSELLGRIIVIKRNGTDGAHFPLRSRECLFGRNNECDIRIQLLNVSKEHARITVDSDKKVWLTNLSTCADTLLNGTKIPDSLEVSHLDVFTISDRSFRFEFPTPKKVTPKKSPKEKRRSSKGTPLKGKQASITPRGSPRTPPVAETLKENIHLLRRYSVPLKEVDESLASPLPSKSPLAKVYENTDMEACPTPSAKRKSSGNGMSSTRKSKRVSFGPFLSPEQFDKELPPATPVRRGATPRRLSSDAKPLLSEKNKRRSVAALPKTPAIFEELELEEEEVNEILEAEPASNLEEAVTMQEVKENDSEELAEVVPASAMESPKSIPNVTPRRSSRRLSKTLTPAKASSEEQPASEAEEELFENKKKTLATPIRKAIEDGVELKKTKQKIATPLRKEIQSKPTLKETKKTLATPIRKEIQEGIKLKTTKKKLATPLRREIKEGLELKATKKKLATPLRKEIQSKPSLKQTKNKLATPLRGEILSKPTLRVTKKKLATPLRREILSKPTLRVTKKKLATPLRREILSKPTLRVTKKKLATPLRREILSKPTLRVTKKKLATPLRREILSKPTLRVTKKKLATPVRQEIQSMPKLRQTKKVMNKELQEGIKQGVKLRATKKVMAYDLQIDIIKGKKLRETRKKMATPLREEIKKGKTLRKTMKSMPTPMKEEIQKGIKLNPTKKALPTSLRDEIKQGVELRSTKKRMATPLKKEIEEGVSLKTRIKKMATPMRKEIEAQPKLKPSKRKSSSSDEENPTKKLKKTESEATKKALKTPLRKDIEAGFKLRQTKRKIATPLRHEIQRRRSLRAVRRKSIKLGVVDEQPARKPTYAEILKRSKKVAVRRLSKKLVRNAKFGPTAAPGAAKVATKQKTHAKEQAVLKFGKQTPKKTKATPTAGRPETVEASEVVVTPVTRNTRKSENWLDTIAKTLNNKEEREMVEENLEGLKEMFATPEEAVKKIKSFRKKSGNWLDTIAKTLDNKEEREMVEENLEGLKEMFATPEEAVKKIKSFRKKSGNWLDAIAKTVHGVKTRKSSPGNLEGLRGLFGTPSNDSFSLELMSSPPLQSVTPSLRSKDSQICVQAVPAQASKTPSLRQAATIRNASRKSVATPKRETEESLSLDMLFSPVQQACTPSLRSQDSQLSVNQEPAKASKTPSLRQPVQLRRSMATPKVIQAIEPAKTPSLRSSTLQVVEAIEVTKTPSLRQPVQSCRSMTTPKFIQAIEPTKTPSLRSSTLQVVEAIEVTKTPSLRSGVVQVVEAVEPSKTPSLRPAAATIKNKKTPKERKSLGLTGVKRLMKTPKVKNNIEDPEENFDAALFATPGATAATRKNEQYKKMPSERKSLGLTGVQRLLKTPKVKHDTENPEENFDAALFATPHSPHKSRKTRNAVADVSGDFVEELAMPKMKSTKSPRIRNAIANVEDSLEAELFGSPGKAKKTSAAKNRTPYTARASRKSKQEEAILPEEEPEVIDVAKLQRTTRGKRAASKDASVKEPAKKRTRRTATKEDQSKIKPEPVVEELKPSRRPTRSSTRGKAASKAKKTSSKTGIVETPKPFLFKRTVLEAIPELPTPMTSPLPSIRTRKESVMSPTLEAIQEKETQEKTVEVAEVKVVSKKSTRGKARAKVEEKPVPATEVEAVVPSTRSGRRTRNAKEPEVVIVEEDAVESKPTRATRGHKAAQEEPREAVKITRSKRNTRGKKDDEVKQLTSELQEVEEPKPKRTNTRAKKEEKAVTEKPTRTTRTRKVEVSAAVEDVIDETTDEKEVKPKSTRVTRRKNAVVENIPTAEEAKPTRSSRGKRAKAVEEPAVEQPKVTRNTRGKKAKVEEVEEEKPAETIQQRATRSKRGAGKTKSPRVEENPAKKEAPLKENPRATRSKRAAEKTPAPKKESKSVTRASKRIAAENVAPSPKKLRMTTRSRK